MSRNKILHEAKRKGYIRMTKSIEKTPFIKATPERVYQALTEKKDLERWFVQKADVELRPGGAVRLEWAPDAVETGEILALEPAERLSYTWVALEPTPTTVTFELTGEKDGTRLHLIHAGIGEGETWDNYYATLNSGWDIHFQHLTAWLETGVSETPAPTGNIKN
jgi:uncharacterized protein YndB with AHSA1/START domain